MPDNVQQMMTDYGIVSGRRIVRSNIIFYRQKSLIMMTTLNDHKDILPPPDLRDLDEEIIKPILSVYTLKEIDDAYEPVGRWAGRDELIETVIEERNEGSQWGWRHNFCNNDDTMNILEGYPSWRDQ